MTLYNLFSYGVEIQYKSYLLSKATLFTLLTSILTIILPFIVAYRSRGFWLRSSYFYEQPLIHSTFDYLFIAETDDPSISIICGETASFHSESITDEENCQEIQIQEEDNNNDQKNDILQFELKVIVPKNRYILSIVLILGIDFQIQTTCPLHMQSLLIMAKEFSGQPNALKYYGDLELYQVKHLPCSQNFLDTTYNNSLFNDESYPDKNIMDIILEKYFRREVTTTIHHIFSRTQNGYMGTMDVNINIRIPEIKFQYTPSLLQELKWAWPQYLSLLIIFSWLFERIRRFVFSNRLLLAWEVVPWKKKNS